VLATGSMGAASYAQAGAVDWEVRHRHLIVTLMTRTRGPACS
jgi:hypothetical protein